MGSPQVSTRLPTHKNVLAAQRRLRGRIHTTPILSSRSLNEMAGVDLLFKCESLQRSGSFKYRGALNATLALPRLQRKLGLATHSSGNHGAAVAAVARSLGLTATVVVPRNASKFKRQAIRRYGGHIVPCGKTLLSRERRLREVLADSGAVYIPPYDHPAIIAGQGTAGLEILQQCPGADELWVPVGGGGLAAGTVLAAGAQVQVVGAQPRLARDAHVSMRRGSRQPPMPPVTVADGLRTGLGTLNFAVLHGYQLPIKLVSEAEIIAAQKLAMSCLKILVEPSSAVPLAALLKYGPVQGGSRKVVVVITGGNVEL